MKSVFNKFVFCVLITVVGVSSAFGQSKSQANDKLRVYEKDIYAEYKIIDGYEMPSRFYLKKGGRFIEIKEDELFDYYVEEIGGQYFVYDLKGKRYQLSFKPEIIDIQEKDASYFEK